MKRIAVTIKIEPELWKEVQHKCIDEDMEYSSYVEEALRKELEEKK